MRTKWDMKKKKLLSNNLDVALWNKNFEVIIQSLKPKIPFNEFYSRNLKNRIKR